MFYNLALYKDDLDIAAGQCGCLEVLENKNILITGATGLIGSFIVDLFIHIRETKGIPLEVFTLGRKRETQEQRFRSHLGKSYFHIIEQDIISGFDLKQKFDFVIHSASNAYPAVFASDPVGTILANIEGVNSLLRHLLSQGSGRLLYVSSGEVYGQVDESIASYTEDCSGYVNTMDPRSCYPTGKRAAETLCAAYAGQYNMDVIVARPCHIYGACTTSTDNRATAQFVNNALAGEDIIMKSPGLQLRSYCYVADCASAIVALLLSGTPANAYNIANPDSEVTIRQIAEAIAGSVGKKVVFELPKDAEKAGYSRITRIILNTSKIEALGWKAVFSMEEGVKRTIGIKRALLAGK